MAMENVGRGEVEEALTVLDRCLIQMRWRLRPPAKRRLALDMVALCTRLRPVVMVDYGGKMPELQEQLYHLFCLAQKESLILNFLRVMVIEEMVYLVHVKSMLEHMHLSLNKRLPLQFAVLDQGPAKLALLEEENSVVGQFLSIKKLFSSVMPNYIQDLIDTPSQSSSLRNISDETASTTSETSPRNLDQQEGLKLISTVGSLDSDSRLTSKAFELIDLSQCVKGTRISPPTLNGWLLGYPIVYLFNREHVAEAASNLSTGPIHLFKILICSKVSFGKEAPKEEELMRYSGESTSKLPPVDIIITTADPFKEPAIITANTVLSVLAIDYPVHKISCYVSDDGASPITFFSLVKTLKFAKKWVPFCRRFDIAARAPFLYFSNQNPQHTMSSDSNFLHEWQEMKDEYEDLKRRIMEVSEMRGEGLLDSICQNAGLHGFAHRSSDVHNHYK